MMDTLHIAPTPSFARELISRRMVEHAAGLDRPLQVLEAGCGREWNIDLGATPVELTGIDLDEKAIAHRRYVVGDLQHAIVGDLRSVPMTKQAYDIVFSAFVLEHIDGAESVLDAMVDALRPGGLLILRVPDGDAVYAFLARLLPFWTHVVYKRIAQRDPLAGKPGHPPYPVVYDDLVSRKGFADYFARHRLLVLDELGTNPHLDNLGRLRPVGRFGQQMIGRLSLGRLADTHSNLTLIAQRPGEPTDQG